MFDLVAFGIMKFYRDFSIIFPWQLVDDLLETILLKITEIVITMEESFLIKC
jgi:hypothetical protein